MRLLETFFSQTLLIICGPPRSGKTTALHLLAPVLVHAAAPATDPSTLARAFQLPQSPGNVAQHSCQAFNDESGLSTHVSVLRVSPASMRWQRFAGSSDSVFFDQVRQLSDVRQQSEQVTRRI